MSTYPSVGDYGDSSVNVPPSTLEYESDVLAWAMEALQEGESYLKNQPGYEAIDDTIRAIMSHEARNTVPGPLSRTNVHQLGKIALDLRSGLTDTKMFWEYSTKNRRYEKAGDVATKLAQAWWLNTQADMRFADLISWDLAAGSSACRVVYNRSEGQQEMQAWDPRDVLPIRPNDMIDYQSGYGVIARKENTLNYLKALYPEKADRIKPDRDGAFARLASTGLWDKVASIASPLLRGLMRDTMRSSAQLKVPSCDTYTIEVKDDSTNDTGRVVLMGPHDSSGKPTANWSYAVQPKEALYPRGRVIVLTKSCKLYDGPNIYWHGKFDFLKHTLDSWPFSWLGKSPMKDLLPLQDSLREAVRLVDNHIKRLQRPPVIGDKNNVPRAAWEKIDTALAGLKVLQNPSMGKGIQLPPIPPLDPIVQWYIQFLIERMEFISGSKDVTNFAKLGQIPASETIEKLMEAMTPAIRARSRQMEAFMRGLSYIVLSNFMQFYTLPKRYRILGDDASALMDFDYDPGTLVPDFVHDEDFDSSGVPSAEARKRGPRPRYERAREWMGQFDLVIQPNSLLKASEVTEKLLYLQLGRAGLIDMFTLLEKLGIHNIGIPPNIPNTIVGRLAYQQQMQLGMAANAAGRKATGQEMPQMRPDGKISESG